MGVKPSRFSHPPFPQGPRLLPGNRVREAPASVPRDAKQSFKERVPEMEGVLPKRDKASPARESSACHATTAYQGHAEPFGSAQGRLREASLPATGSKSNPGLALRPVGW